MAADALANSGHFFGMTTLGATDPFFDAAATTLRHPFHEIDEGAFLAAFDARLLATTSRGRAEAAILQVDASSCIMRGSLGAMLNDILGRSASRAELAAWFTFLDYDTGCIMTRAEFAAGIGTLRSWSAAPERARSYKSFTRWREDKAQHRRVAWEPQRALTGPVTAAQTVGWHAPKPHYPAAGERHTLPHTDVTKREGRTHATFYGELN